MTLYKSINLLLVIATISQFILLWHNSIRYKRLMDDKNVKLIQFYLDMKFLWKAMIDNLHTTNSTKFCIKLISEIKDYYHLEDVIIIDSIRMIDRENGAFLRSKIIHFITHNINKIEQRLKGQKFIKMKTRINDTRLVLHISSIVPQVINDGLVVCVEKSPSLLSEHELISLETAVNLLKTRLLYD